MPTVTFALSAGYLTDENTWLASDDSGQTLRLKYQQQYIYTRDNGPRLATTTLAAPVPALYRL
eukprot:30153-Eustigmatos_ZCMA.PRE.1